MPSAALATASYGQPRDAVLTQRQVEYKLFAQATHRLSSAARALASTRETRDAAAFACLADAVHENQRLWVALAADVASDANELPETLRAGILSLAQFVRVHGAKVLAGEAAPDALVDVNASIMKGLRGGGGATGSSALISPFCQNLGEV